MRPAGLRVRGRRSGGRASGLHLTGHVHHPAAAHAQDLVGLAEQAAGADAVCVVSRELLFAGGAAVPPGLGQVGQLSTQRDLLDLGPKPVRLAVMKKTYPLFLARNKGLESRGDAEAQLVDVGRLVLTVDLNSDAGLQGRLVFRMRRSRSAEHCKGERTAELQAAASRDS